MQAISSLAEAAYNTADTSEDQPMTYYLSPLYSALMSKILAWKSHKGIVMISATHHSLLQPGTGRDGRVVVSVL